MVRSLCLRLLCLSKGTLQKGDIKVLEKVQKKATKIIPEIRHLPYSDRLKVCKLPTLHYRQVREDDIIEMYKILTGKYDADVTPKVTRVYESITRGNVLQEAQLSQRGRACLVLFSILVNR